MGTPEAIWGYTSHCVPAPDASFRRGVRNVEIGVAHRPRRCSSVPRRSRSMTHTVLIVNLGTPSAPTDAAIRDFLRDFLGDPRVVDWPAWFWKPVLRLLVLRFRPGKIRPLYESIWTERGAPLHLETEQIVDALNAQLPEGTQAEAVYRYGEPSLERRLEEAMSQGPVTVCSLFPHLTSSTTGTIDQLVERARRRQANPPEVRVFHPDAADPGLIQALVDRYREATSGMSVAPDHLVFSYHGIPVRHDRREDGLYSGGCHATTRAFLERIGWPEERATTAFQSRFGPEPWLGPATDDTLEELARKGVRRVVVLTPGFLTDGLETIEEIGEEARETFLEAGGKELVRVEAVKDHPAFIEALRRIVLLAGNRPQVGEGSGDEPESVQSDVPTRPRAVKRRERSA